mmetsp:Transcript_32208/g.57774  ORF Transcript_32208/g.57774 Transcript_32208/m.57774 type:complete len:407 (+) Transcript_32208:2262-3482(+)
MDLPAGDVQAHQPQRGPGRRFILQQLVIHHLEKGPVGHVVPAFDLPVRVNDAAILLGGVPRDEHARVPGRHESLLVCNGLRYGDRGRRGGIRVPLRQVQPQAAADVVVHGVHTVSVGADVQQSGLAPLVPLGGFAHHPDLDECALADRGDGIDVVVAQVEVPTEPGLDLWGGADHGQKPLWAVGVVHPGAHVLDVHLLQGLEVAAQDGGMREDEDIPVLVLLNGALKPLELRVINPHLVTAAGGVTESDRREADEDGVRGDLGAPVRLRVEGLLPCREILLVGQEVHGLQVVVARNDVVRPAEARQEPLGPVEALLGARVGLVARQVPQGDDPGAGGLVQVPLQVALAFVEQVHLRRVQVQVPQHRDPHGVPLGLARFPTRRTHGPILWGGRLRLSALQVAEKPPQ